MTVLETALKVITLLVQLGFKAAQLVKKSPLVLKVCSPLVQTTKGRNLTDLNTQADAIVMSTFGVTFMQEGEDFLRSKSYEESGATKYDENSYKSGDFINDMDYELKATNANVFNYYKELLAFRKSSKLFSVNTRNEVNSRLSSITTSGKNVSYTVTANNETYFFIHAVDGASFNLAGQYEIVLSSKLDSSAAIANNSITLASNESVILKPK